VLAALHLRDPRREALCRLNDTGWRAALDFCDRSRLTLAVRDAARDAMPAWVRDRTDADAAKNQERVAGIEAAYRELSARLDIAGVDFIALKGLTHCALFGLRPELRAQYDIDLFAPLDSVYAARDALIAAGYESVEALEGFPTDHLPVLIRKTGWEWRGDYFDTGIPLSVDLHFQFWNEWLERLPVSGAEEFWYRRTKRTIGGVELGVLDRVDALGYAALHLLRHLLRGSLMAYHVFEVAQVLDRFSADEDFWKEWRVLHEPNVRRLEAVVFRLAAEWFGCAVAPPVQEEMDELSPATRTWFSQFAMSPARAQFQANKDEIWLHCSLVLSRTDAWSIARRRLLPGNLPPWGAGVHVPREQLTWGKRAKNLIQHAAYSAGRARHHLAAIPRITVSGSRWWWNTNGLGQPFWLFLVSAVLFNFALFIFVLLYNLYLVDLGFGEAFLGVLNGANRVGSLAGTLPAAYAAHRFGLRRTLLATIAGTAAVSFFRGLVVSRTPLVILGFAAGGLFAGWAVVLAPVIAGAVPEERRPAAFSTFFGTMLVVGVAGTWLGGRLALWLHGTRVVLLVASALSGLALLPALRLRLAPILREGARVYPRGGFLPRFLAAFAIWNLATGAFNPFANVYFARLHFSVEQIGTVFSISQAAQVATLLLAPLVFRRAGLVGGITGMMLATGVALGGLAARPPGAAAALAFTAYMSFQWMSEPGLNSLLMSHVAESERSGTSALNYLVAFGCQALAAFAGGAWLERFGYGAVLAGAAALAAGAGMLFRVLLGTVEKKPVAARAAALPLDAGH
jgi:MFS family permease